MKIFLSWSGDLSRDMASFLKKWLPSVVQSVEPWTSEEINKGSTWNGEISNQLEASSFGIVCLTPANLMSPWIHFEAGAIAKSVPGALTENRVTPLLLGVEPKDLDSPLAQFQATRPQKTDVLALMRSINAATETPLDAARLDESFSRWWPDFEDKTSQLLAKLSEEPTKRGSVGRSAEEVLADILQAVRNHERSLLRLSESIRMGHAPQPTVFEPPLNPLLEDLVAIAHDLNVGTTEWILHEGGQAITIVLGKSPGREAVKAFAEWSSGHGVPLTVKTKDSRWEFS